MSVLLIRFQQHLLPRHSSPVCCSLEKNTCICFYLQNNIPQNLILPCLRVLCWWFNVHTPHGALWNWRSSAYSSASVNSIDRTGNSAFCAVCVRVLYLLLLIKRVSRKIDFSSFGRRPSVRRTRRLSLKNNSLYRLRCRWNPQICLFMAFEMNEYSILWR